MSHLLQLNFYKRPPLYERPHFLRTVQRPPLYSSCFLLFPRWPLRRVSTLIMQYNIREYCTPFIFSLSFGLHFTSFSHPSYKNHQGSFHLSPSLVNIHFFPSAFQDQEWRLLHQAFRSRDPSDKCPARRSGLNCMNLAFATTFIFDVLWTRLKFFSLVSWPFFDFPDLYNTHVHSLIKCIDSVWSCCYFRKGKVRCNPFLNCFGFSVSFLP